MDQVDAVVEQLHPVPLPEGAFAVGRTLAESGLEALEVTVTAVRRGGIRGPEPEPDTLIQAGDVLILHGAPERLEQAEARLLRG
jgi:CPA2 family monovalent cation:H+ antiporter-2